MYDVLNYSLLVPNVLAFYVKLNQIFKTMNFILRYKFFSVYSHVVNYLVRMRFS